MIDALYSEKQSHTTAYIYVMVIFYLILQSGQPNILCTINLYSIPCFIIVF
jgi:hypothetical protein